MINVAVADLEQTHFIQMLCLLSLSNCVTFSAQVAKEGAHQPQISHRMFAEEKTALAHHRWETDTAVKAVWDSRSDFVPVLVAV